MSRKYLSSGTKWEETLGYSRAVRAGNIIEVSGAVSVTNSGEIVGENDAYLIEIEATAVLTSNGN